MKIFWNKPNSEENNSSILKFEMSYFNSFCEKIAESIIHDKDFSKEPKSLDLDWAYNKIFWTNKIEDWNFDKSIKNEIIDKSFIKYIKDYSKYWYDLLDKDWFYSSLTALYIKNLREDKNVRVLIRWWNDALCTTDKWDEENNTEDKKNIIFKLKNPTILQEYIYKLYELSSNKKTKESRVFFMKNLSLFLSQDMLNLIFSFIENDFPEKHFLENKFIIHHLIDHYIWANPENFDYSKIEFFIWDKKYPKDLEEEYKFKSSQIIESDLSSWEKFLENIENIKKEKMTRQAFKINNENKKRQLEELNRKIKFKKNIWNLLDKYKRHFYLDESESDVYNETINQLDAVIKNWEVSSEYDVLTIRRIWLKLKDKISWNSVWKTLESLKDKEIKNLKQRLKEVEKQRNMSQLETKWKESNKTNYKTDSWNPYDQKLYVDPKLEKHW